MQNQGRGQFSYDVFKAAYDSDPKLQQLVTNFDQDKIEFKVVVNEVIYNIILQNMMFLLL